MIGRLSLLLAATLIFTSILPTQIHGATSSSGEARAEKALAAARKQGSPEIYAFLKMMPKGADLHMHLSGSVYAETFIDEAARQGLCVAPVDHGVPAAPVGQNAVRFVPPQNNQPNDCAQGEVPAADALKRQPLYDNLIDSFSMRAFVPTQGINGHDQFFATFDRFSGLKDVHGEWLDQLATRAAAQNEQYLEVMSTPTFSHAAALGYKLGWPTGITSDNYRTEFARLRDQLIAGGLRDEIAIDRKEFADAEFRRRQIEECDSSDAAFGAPSIGYPGPTRSGRQAACDVEIRWLYQVLRGFPPQQVFAQMLLGFEVASGDPNVVGINLVMPEDGYLSMRDYRLQMEMVDYLHVVYPKVHIALHAGELASGLVTPAGLSFHVRDAVEVGHAERIGHGADILYEDRPYELMREMAIKHIIVEINLTSNDVILGLKGKAHPLHAYIAAHVPFALSTDDEGVSRIDLTHEYVKAVIDQDLNYVQLKQSARASLEHSFLPGKSLWAAPDDFAHRRTTCGSPIALNHAPSPGCQAFLRSNEKATEQYELEKRFVAFESMIDTDRRATHRASQRRSQK